MLFQDVQLTDEGFDGDDAESALIEVQKKENIIEKSFDKLKETSRVWLCSVIIIPTKHYSSLGYTCLCIHAL